MNWFQLAVLALKFGTALMERARAAREFTAGENAEALDAAKAVLALTERGRRIQEAIDALPDDQLGGLLDDLGRAGERPGVPPGVLGR